MNVQDAVKSLRAYAAYEIDSTDGDIILRHATTGDESEKIISDYLSQYGQLRIIPKKKLGNAYVREQSARMLVVGDTTTVPQQPLNGFDGTQRPMIMPQMQPTPSNTAELYKIMWENEKQTSREYKEKYERTLNDLRKLEIEHAESKNNVTGNLVQGIAGVLPAFMQQQNGGLGNAPQQAKPIQDKRAGNIIRGFMSLDEDNREAFYGLSGWLMQHPENIAPMYANINDPEE